MCQVIFKQVPINIAGLAPGSMYDTVPHCATHNVTLDPSLLPYTKKALCPVGIFEKLAELDDRLKRIPVQPEGRW